MIVRYLGMPVYGIPRVRVATLVMGKEVGPAGLAGVVKLPTMKVGSGTYPFAYLMIDDGAFLPRLEGWAGRRAVKLERLESEEVKKEFREWLKGKGAMELLERMADEREAKE